MTTADAARTTPAPSTDVDALAQWDDNGNGRITCAEARAHGIAPVHHDYGPNSKSARHKAD